MLASRASTPPPLPTASLDSVTVPFFLYLHGDHRALHPLLHSFPTRRSSDLAERVGLIHELAQLARAEEALYHGRHRARDRKSTRLNSSHIQKSRMPSSA